MAGFPQRTIMMGSPLRSVPDTRRPARDNGNGSGGNYGERLAAIEERLNHIPTKAWILTVILSLMGTMLLVSGTIIAVLLRMVLTA